MQTQTPPHQPDAPRFPKSARVLILDDERFDRHRLQRLSSGLPVTLELATADSLAAFACLLEQNSYDLIFVDYELPDGSGLDALEMLRLCPRNCTAATLMVTGFIPTDLADRALAAGCTDVLAKDDLTPALFSMAVSDALYRPRATLPQAHSYAPHQVQDILQKAGHGFAHDMKPYISRMLRQLRNLRDAPVGTHNDSIQIAEASCAGLWDHLVALERKVHDIPEPLQAAIDTDRAAVQSRRPPSPFSRMN